MITSGNAGQIDLLNNSNTPFGPRFVWEGNALYQQSSMSPDVRWEIPQTIDTIDPLSAHYNPKSAYAKTLRRDGKTWGGVITSHDSTTNSATVVSNHESKDFGSAEVIDRRYHLAHDNSVTTSCPGRGRLDREAKSVDVETSLWGAQPPINELGVYQGSQRQRQRPRWC